MRIEEAIELIGGHTFDFSTELPWLDLGSGAGIFTRALATIMAGRGSVVALDRDLSALHLIPDQIENTSIRKVGGDFSNELPAGTFGGMILANSLHFVSDKSALVKKVKQRLTDGGAVLLVEYEMDKPNNWIPYPIPFARARRLFLNSGFENFNKLHERPSLYNNAMMYSASGILARR